jgi:PKD repeat protein
VKIRQHGREIALLVLLWMVCFERPAPAQPLGPVVTIPIEKVRETYNNPHEDGTGKNCGIRLYGEWTAYRNYTNRSSYRIFTPGLQSTASPQSSVPLGGRFRFYCWFNGVSSPRNDTPCPDKIGESLPDWYVEIQRRGPSARFTSRPQPPEPGRFEFASTSTDPEGELLVESWNFGDGSSSGGTSPTHRYTQPGRFTVRLTVTDTDALTNSTTRTVTVPAPKPVVSLRLLSKHTGNRIELGEDFGVRVTVRAGEEGVGALSNLAFISPPLTVPGLFSIVKPPAETNIGTLLPGEAREFNWTLRANLAGEFALIASAVTGKDAVGQTVSGASATTRGEVTSLILGITQHPSRFVVGGDNNNDGETNLLDRFVELVVGITNVTQQDVTGVKALIPADPIQLTSLAQDLNIWLTPVTVPPGEFGTIKPGAANAVLRTNVYQASDRTYAEASIIVQGKVGEAGVQSRGEGIVNIGGDTLLEARFDVEDRPYKSGQPVRVFGTLKNVSRFVSKAGEVIHEGKTLGVVVYPKTEGNGGGGFLYRADSGGRTPTGPEAFTLAPDEELEVEAIIPTSEAPEVSSLKLHYDVAVFIHGGPGDPVPAKPTEYEVVEEDGWSASHTVTLLGVPPINDPWITCPLDLSLGGYLSCRFVEGLNGAYRGLADLGTLAGTLSVQIPAWRLQLQAWRLWMMEQTIDALRGDQAALQRLATEITIDLEALKNAGVTSLQGVVITADNVLRAMDKSIRTNTALYQAGNYKQIAGNLVETTGENVDLAFEALVAARTLRTAMLASEGVENTASAALRNSLQRQTDELAGVVADARVRGIDLPTSGLLRAGMDVTDLPSVWRDAYGARKQDIQNLLKVARDEGVTIAFRSRSARSGDLLDAGLAYNKPGGVSLKTVNDIDRIYLGYEDEWEGICMLVEPPVAWKPPGADRDALIDAYLDRFGQLTSPSDFSKDLRASVRERLETRLDEWPKQLEKFSGYVDEGIDVDFHLERNGLPERLRPNSKVKRDALVTPGEIPSRNGIPRRRTFRLQMEGPPPNGTGVFRDITGDIDLLAILGADGKPITDLAKRLRIYDKLQRLIGIQHGESFTYSGGEKLRESFLRCCVEGLPGAETLLAAGPDARLRSTYFSDKKSVFTTGPNNEIGPIIQQDFAFLPGTISELVSELRPSSGLQLPSLSSALDQAGTAALIYSPVLLGGLIDNLQQATGTDQFHRTNAASVQPDGVGGAQTYSAAGASSGPGLLAAVRVSRRGSQLHGGSPALAGLEAAIQELAAAGHPLQPPTPPPGASGGQWRPVDASTLLSGANGDALRLAPLTYITEDVPEGATVVPTVSLRELGMNPGSPFFAVGDQVVIDPGGPDEEFATLVSVNPFTFSRPLTSAKPIGTRMLFLSGVADGNAVPGTLPALENLLVWLRADAGVELEGTNVVSWTDQSDNGFVFRPSSVNTRPGWVGNSTSGVPAIRFNASSTPRLHGNLHRTLTNATIFTLARYLNNSNGDRYVYAFGTINFSGLMMTLAREGGADIYHYDGAAQRVARDTIPGTGFRIFSQVYGGDGPDHHRLAVDGRTVVESRTTVGRAYSASATNVVLGKYVTATYGFTGDLTEWIVYDRPLTATERLQVEEYLRQRAGLPPFFAPGSLALDAWQPVGYDPSSAPEANWNLDQANRSVVSPSASDPSLLLSPFDTSNGQVIRARLSAASGPGFMGFVFGYRGPGQFYLLDWQQAASAHPEYGSAPAGLRLRQFHIPDGSAPNGTDWWSSPTPARVTTLHTHEATWVANRDYELVLELEPDRIELTILDGITPLVAWSVEDAVGTNGQFGYYVNGLAGGRFGQITLPGLSPRLTGIRREGPESVTLDWIGGLGPYRIEAASDLNPGDWIEAAPATPNQTESMVVPPGNWFFRIRSPGSTP